MAWLWRAAWLAAVILVWHIPCDYELTIGSCHLARIPIVSYHASCSNSAHVVEDRFYPERSRPKPDRKLFYFGFFKSDAPDLVSGALVYPSRPLQQYCLTP